jgi:streptogramin lyase
MRSLDLYSFGYHSRQWRRLIFTSLLVVTSIALASGLDSGAVRAETNIIHETSEATAIRAAFGNEYAVPNGPRNLVAEGPGRIWYTSTDAGGIGFLEVISEPDDPVVRYRTDFYGMGQRSEPYDLDYHNGVVWFTLRGIRSLGRIDVATREIKTYLLNSFGAGPTGIDVDPSGMVWIAQNNGRISRFDPTTEKFVEFFLPDFMAETPRIEDIVYQDARNIWFTMPDGNRAGVFDSTRERFFDFPTSENSPSGLFIESGRVWVTANGSNRIGRFTPTTVSVWIWFDTPTPDGGPVGILVFDDAKGIQQVWVTENRAGTIGRLQLNNFDLLGREKVGPANPPGNTWGIIRASDGHIWVADAGRNLLYELIDPYIRRLYIASVTNHQVAIPQE